MELWQIRYFLQVAEDKSISAAAKNMHISQPPLSRHIKAVEEEIGVPLFERKTYGLVLTEAGHLLQERGNELISLYSKMMLEMEEMFPKEKSKIVFGANDGGKDLIIPLCTKILYQKKGNVEVITRYESTAEILLGIEKGDIDIGFLRIPFFRMNEFDIIELGSKKWIALMDKNYPGAKSWGDSLTLKQLNEQPLILPSRQALYLPLVKALTVDDKIPNVVCYYFELEKAIELAIHKLGISIVPSSIVNISKNKNYMTKNIQDLNMVTCYAAIKKRGEFSNETLRKFWDYISHVGEIY